MKIIVMYDRKCKKYPIKKEGVHVIARYVFLVFFVFLCIIRDFRTYKVSNYYILAGFVFGFAAQIYLYGIQGIMYSISGVIFPILILYPLFFIKALGAGDIKLFSVIGAFLGWKIAVQSILLSFLFGAMIALIKLVSQKIFFSRVYYFLSYVSTAFFLRKVTPYYDEQRDGHACTMHFTLAIGISILALIGMDVCHIKIVW